MFCISGPNLVILAWMGDELSCGQARDWYTHTHTHTRTHRPTDAGDDNTRRPKLASGKKCSWHIKSVVVWWKVCFCFEFHIKDRWCNGLSITNIISPFLNPTPPDPYNYSTGPYSQWAKAHNQVSNSTVNSPSPCVTPLCSGRIRDCKAINASFSVWWLMSCSTRG